MREHATEHDREFGREFGGEHTIEHGCERKKDPHPHPRKRGRRVRKQPTNPKQDLFPKKISIKVKCSITD
jgi:hypothetical protein